LHHEHSVLRDIAAAFHWGGAPREVRPLGQGLVNETYGVWIDADSEPSGVLQCINARVFPQPQWIMDNIRVVSDHLRRHPQHPGSTRHDIRLPAIITTREGRDHHLDREGRYWRALEYLPRARTLDRIETPEQARGVGFALGRLHHLLGDLAPERLHDPLPGLHATPRYLARLEAVSGQAREVPLSADLRFCMRFIGPRRRRAAVLEEARRAGRLALRPIHGDPKLNNIVFDARDRVLGLIDLDTLKPGLIHYDIGDCLRSCCNPAGESAEDLDEVRFDLEIAELILKAYIHSAGEDLSPADYELLCPAIQLIPFELGLRFLIDHLEGDVYFRVDYTQQNLHRALVQFLLTSSIEAQGARLRRLISRLGEAGPAP